MKKDQEFSNIFDECLERLLVKGETVEQCLQSYPEQAAELEPLLQTALATQKASVIQPRPEFRARARYQFGLALQEIGQKKRLPFFSRQPRWATVVAIVLVLLLAGGSTVAAAGNSMPDSPLYQVKLTTEQVQLALTPSALGKAELYARLADKRVAEIIYLANKGKSEPVDEATQRLDSYLANIAVLAMDQEKEAGVLLAPAPSVAPSEQARGGKDAQVQANGRGNLRMRLAHSAVDNSAHLHAVLETAPESAKPALRRAIAVSETGYEKALASLD